MIYNIKTGKKVTLSAKKYPQNFVPQIAIQTVNHWLEEKEMLVIFCVYGKKDNEIYNELLFDGFEELVIPSRTEYLKLVEKRIELLINLIK